MGRVRAPTPKPLERALFGCGVYELLGVQPWRCGGRTGGGQRGGRGARKEFRGATSGKLGSCREFSREFMGSTLAMRGP